MILNPGGGASPISKFVTGEFKGGGTTPTEITLGFRPKVVILTANCGLGSYGAMATDGASVPVRSDQLTITDTGFIAKYARAMDNINQSDVPYRYVALA